LKNEGRRGRPTERIYRFHGVIRELAARPGIKEGDRGPPLSNHAQKLTPRRHRRQI
jgi:hypothetical protein